MSSHTINHDFLRVCQIGLGSISRYWINAIQKNPKTRLVAVCDVNCSTTTKFLQQHPSITVFSDYRECCKDPQIDVVIVAVPPDKHTEIVLCGLKNKKKVIVEKPLSILFHDAQKCLDAVRETNGALYLAYHSMFGATYQKAKSIMSSLLASGDTVERVSCRCCENVVNYHTDGSSSSWLFKKAIGGGGVLIDSGINSFSLILDITGPVKVKDAHLYFRDREVEDVVEISFENDRGLKEGKLYFNWACPEGEKGEYTFQFQSSTIVSFEWCSGTITVTRPGKPTENITVNNRDSSVDRSQVPMAIEYQRMLEDSLQFFSMNEEMMMMINQKALLPFKATFDAYKIATRSTYSHSKY